MKRLVLLLIAACCFCAVKAQTADEIIAKYFTASGGKDKIEAIKSMQYVQVISIPSPQGTIEMNVLTIREKNKLFRNQMSNDMVGDSYSIITDTAMWIKKPANPFTGDEGGLEKVNAAEAKLASNNLDCSGFFPELVNYATKGYSVELLGEGKGNGRDSYKVKLKKDKAEIIYYFDKETGLVNSTTLKGEALAAMGAMMGGAANELTMDFENYQEVSGVKVPGVMKITTMMGELSLPIKEVKINEPVDAKWYKAE